MASRVSDDSAPSVSDAGRSDADSSVTTKAATDSRTTKSEKPTRRRKPAPSKKSRATSIQADLDKLEARLKRADATTRKSVKSLETVVSALEVSLNKSESAQKGRVTRQVSELTERLERQSSEMRMAVRRELKSALAEGSLADLDSALGRASLRLDRAEIDQAEAIARINKHLADMARAVDTRIKAEAEARRKSVEGVTQRLSKAIAQTKSDVERRVDTVERDSAAAFDKVGDTIERIYGQLEDRRKADTERVSETVNALADQTRADLDAYRAKLEARLDEVEKRHLAVGTGAAERVVERAREDIGKQIDALQKRVNTLEEKSAETASAAAVVPLPPLPDPKLPGQAMHVSGESSALSDRVSALQAPRPDTANPYAPALKSTQGAAAISAMPSVPETVTLDRMVEPAIPAFAAPPSPVVPFPQAPNALVEPHVIPNAAPAPTSNPAMSPTSAPPLPPFQLPSGTMTEDPNTDFESAPIPDAVYSNPAYAEGVNARAGRIARDNTDSPTAVRISDDGRSRRFALPALSGGTLRIALLATGAIVVALFASRIILGSSDGDTVATAPDTRNVVTTAPDGQTLPLGTSPVPSVGGPAQTGQAPGFDQTPPPLPGASQTLPQTLPQGGLVAGDVTAPIGQYEENAPIVIDADQFETLDAAVQAGNPIAQFQLGLSRLDAGETDQGAALIRQAASANQPAALYRLAKLYEAGEGVPRDDVMSRQLIERAARGGNRIAMHDLALYYTEGRGGVDLDMALAKSWFEQAARRGVVDSQFNLAILSESPEAGTQTNPEDALFWYSVAARQGDQFAVTRRDALRGSLDQTTLDAVDSRLSSFAPRPIDEEANGIFKDVPWANSAQAAPTRADIRQAQSLLTTLGYSVGTPDGLMGNRTRDAIRQFQRTNGMSETGEVSQTLINRLNTASRA